MFSDDRRDLRFLFTLACVIIVVGGMKIAGDLLLPLMVAAFLAILCMPPMRRLQRHGVPPWLSIIIVVTMATVIVFLVTAIIGGSITQFDARLPYYRGQLNAMVADFLGWLRGTGLDVSVDEMTSKMDSAKLLDLVKETAQRLLGAISNFFVVVLVLIFMLIEANEVPIKLRLAIGDPDADLGDYRRAAEQVYKYVAIKAVVSLVTGLLAAVLVAALGVDFPLMWGLLAFLFNFVPNIGSIIAAVPPVLLANIQYGSGTALGMAAGYFAINMVIGNVVEPKLMGRRLGLSPLVVILSLLFWEWIWGPVGMLLSVPLTVIVKIMCEHSDDFRWLAVMLGHAGDPPQPAAAPPEPPTAPSPAGAESSAGA